MSFSALRRLEKKVRILNTTFFFFRVKSDQEREDVKNKVVSENPELTATVIFLNEDSWEISTVGG